MPIKTKKQKKEKERQNRPSEIRLSGVPPPIMPIKNPKINTFIRGPPYNA